MQLMLWLFFKDISMATDMMLNSAYFLQKFSQAHNFDLSIPIHDINHCIAGAPTAPIPPNTRLSITDSITISLPPTLDSIGIETLFNDQAALETLHRLMRTDIKLREQFLLPRNEILAVFLDASPLNPTDYMFKTIGDTIVQPEEAIIPFFKDTLLLEYYRIHLQNILFNNNIKNDHFYAPSPAEYDQQIHAAMPILQYPDNVAFICNDVPIGNGHEAIYESETTAHLVTNSPLIFSEKNQYFLFGDNITAVHLKPTTHDKEKSLWQVLGNVEQNNEERFWKCPSKRLAMICKNYSQTIASPYEPHTYYTGPIGTHNVFVVSENDIVDKLPIKCHDILESPENTLRMIEEKFKL